MIGALCIHSAEMMMIKTSRDAVCIARDYEYIGFGDSPRLRFLEAMTCEPITGGYATEQAFKLSTYLTHQAKMYVDGCGGATQVRILWPGGGLDVRDGLAKEAEREILEIESRLGIAVSMSFDQRVTAKILQDNWQIAIDKLKKGRA